MSNTNLMKAMDNFANSNGEMIQRKSISKFPPRGSNSYDHDEQGNLYLDGLDKDGKQKYRKLSPMSFRPNKYQRDLIEALAGELGQKPTQVLITALLHLAQSRDIE